MPATERPPVRTDTAEKPPIPLMELVAQRREMQERMERERAEREMALQSRGSGNGSDGPAD